MKDIQKYLYHGINSNDLESILKSGYIMTRNSLRQYLFPSDWIEFERLHEANWNGEDAVSITCHPDNLELIEKYNIIKSTSNYHYDNAYITYILTNTSLVLDPIILEHFQIKQKSLKMGYEIQILGDIPISYIKAIGINTNLGIATNTFSPTNINKFRKVLNELENSTKGKNFSKYYDETFNIRDNFHNTTLEKIYQRCLYTNYVPYIEKLLKTYNLAIPIVDLKYGYELPDPETHKRKIKSLKRKYDNYINKNNN